MRFVCLLGLVGALAGCDTFFAVEGNLVECGTAAPIAGAQVTVMTDPGAWEGPETETTTTTADGHFQIELDKPKSEPATVSFSKVGFAPFSRDFPNGVPDWPYPIDVCMNAVIP